MATKKNEGTRLRGGAAGAITALGLLAIAIIGNFEGLRLVAYKDVVGVWTACYGETKGIKGGMKFTREQCDVMFIDSGLKRHEAGMRACLTYPDLIPEKSYVAFLSLTYNIGIGGFCKSSVARAINEGRIQAACYNLTKFNKAKGRVIKGLVTRRKQELRLCLDGVAEGLPPPVKVEPVYPEEKPDVQLVH